MKNLVFLLTICFVSFNVYSQKSLFNGKNLENWDIFLGSPIPWFEDLEKNATPESTYKVISLEGQKVIHVSGNINAALSTKKEYGNYHLRLEFKWGEKVYGKRNSGLLYHSFGPFGAAFETWMATIELQMMHQNLGDTYLMANTYCESAVTKSGDGNSFMYDPQGKPISFSETDNGRSVKKAFDAEKPLGEWNTIDLYCYGQTTVHVVNGQAVMVNTNCSKLEDGLKLPLTKGKIQIQSEGGEFFIRKVEIEKIKGIPAELLR